MKAMILAVVGWVAGGYGIGFLAHMGWWGMLYLAFLKDPHVWRAPVSLAEALRLSCGFWFPGAWIGLVLILERYFKAAKRKSEMK